MEYRTSHKYKKDVIKALSDPNTLFLSSVDPRGISGPLGYIINKVEKIDIYTDSGRYICTVVRNGKKISVV